VRRGRHCGSGYGQACIEDGLGGGMEFFDVIWFLANKQRTECVYFIFGYDYGIRKRFRIPIVSMSRGQSGLIRSFQMV
jgi:hypothetical protein